MVIQYDEGILFVAPNPSSALHKISEIYDRIAFAAVGRYNEFENLRKAGVRYADMTGYQYDRRTSPPAGWPTGTPRCSAPSSPRATSRSRSSWWWPRWARRPTADQIYRITFDGSVAEEHGFVAMGGQADQVAAVLKDRYADGHVAGRGAGRGDRRAVRAGQRRRSRLSAGQLEVGILDRDRVHRTFRRLTSSRLEVLLAEARGGSATPAAPVAPPPGEPASPDDTSTTP